MRQSRPIFQPRTNQSKSNDSDSDGIPDGWELGNGLDPTDPWDARLDFDFDGLDLDQSGDGIYERLWTNLDEFRYIERTEDGYNSTIPTLEILMATV